MLNSWRFLELNGHDPYRNLACEEAVFKSIYAGSSPNTICFYINDKTVVLGCFQSVEREIDHSYCKRNNVRILRRITGGGCVYQDLGNLNYSITIKKPHPLISEDLLTTSRMLILPIIEILKNFELEPIFEENSIYIKDKKVGGIACAVKRGAFLLHGTLLASSRPDQINRVLKLDTLFDEKLYFQKRGTPSNKKNVTTLSMELGKKISMLELIEKLKIMFEKCYNIKLIDGSLNKYEITLLGELMRNKYLQPEWNFKM